MVSGVHDIVSPSHSNAVSDGILELSNADSDVAVGVTGGRSPSHKGRLVLTPGVELDCPSLANSLVSGVAVEMLTLRHVDASNF
jgi:hypothetical protein